MGSACEWMLKGRADKHMDKKDVSPMLLASFFAFARLN